MELRHERRGNGPRLLLVHGLGASLAVWRPVMERLAREREVVAVDMPGFGGSAPLENGIVPSPDNIARALAEFCGRHDFERPHVAGNSLGAWVAFEMAKQGSAASVCAISPAGMWRQALGPRRFEQFSIAQRLRPLAHLLLATGPGRSRLLGTNMAHPERLTKDEASELVFGYLELVPLPRHQRGDAKRSTGGRGDDRRPGLDRMG